MDSNLSKQEPRATHPVLWRHLGFVICKSGKLFPPSRRDKNEHPATGLGMESPFSNQQLSALFSE